MGSELDTIAAAAGRGAIRDLDEVSGGDINRAHRVTFDDGSTAFLKRPRGGAPSAMFEAEAHGLRWLAEADALRVPEVLAFDEGYLLLEDLGPGRARADDHDEALGRGLAALHRASPGAFGLDRDNYIGPLRQRNAPAASWAAFYRRRLEDLVRLAVDGGIDVGWAQALERFDLEARLGPEEPPARLHGDLWSGNAHADPEGRPCLIDPAVYGGHREMDLAMMALFGGFSARTFAAYDEVYPRAPGHRERIRVHQLVPLLVHAILFGGGYVGSVTRILRKGA
jgi:fructosamine-3-kinase